MGRTSWPDENSRILLNILNEEKNRGVSKFNWGNIAKKFNAQKECNVTGKQVQNHYSDLKERYKGWEELQGLSGISFNPITKKVAVDEKSLERYNAFIERNAKYGLKIIRGELANIDEMSKLFDGKFAHGVGGCFSPAMAKGPSYLSRQIEDLTNDETSQDNEVSGDDEFKETMFDDEHKAPPTLVDQKVFVGTSRKRKVEEPISPEERKRRETSFDRVIALLMDNVRRASIIIALEELRRSLVPSDANLMIERNLLVDGKYIKVDEQIGICLYILAKGSSYRDVADRFKHSISTICVYFKKVLDALVILSHDIIRPHRDLLEVPPEVENNSLYWPYFKDAIGAIDGTHIEAVISDRTGTPFRNRNGRKTWNVLGCCSFDRIFTFINVGWEGSAHDLTVWRDSLTASKYVFPHPPEEKVEGVLKTMPQMLPKYQMSIIVSCFTLHNFIRMHKLGIPIVQHDAVIGRTDTNLDDKDRMSLMSKVRMDIAKAIWKDNNPEEHEDGVSQNDNEEEHMEVDDPNN
ncbi:uncharacterized protein LOC141608662 [Silene latifolia]|uniref:uncharacterized protein LOC141608662 n=1 Tax=Silene latifolia TaxID=37657 RepID=UPI003D771183